MSTITSLAGSMPSELLPVPGPADQLSPHGGDSEDAVLVQPSGELTQQQAVLAPLCLLI
jgi:hypothetical protein